MVLARGWIASGSWTDGVVLLALVHENAALGESPDFVLNLLEAHLESLVFILAFHASCRRRI